MQQGRTYKVQKLLLVKKIERMTGRRCVICLNRNPGRNIFTKMRRGTC